MIMSAVMKPELYFQPASKQKQKLWRCQVEFPTAGLSLSFPKARERAARLLCRKSVLLFSAESCEVEDLGDPDSPLQYSPQMPG